ncbi:MAG: bifunctional UDP-N-acetylglucosamine diphosphorylase/glucosamine-1-phosphate N-acetyltransferase GlmU [Gammaproteobacteria bacterium]|nr:bifunctional UDP-N-acetylglucosamine diphosphorylase/glucosamine-1-phosphate N-acetyltransferase GlmU [Gammaproteobacteria bacterium]MCF6229882.1 bifunctional UDP-N-acetylglucosamine diphosphorylase/glucosamine-1-phosphate N-acetyltransferase GlmU [Gammaproteobacteria bacterium]
MQKLVVIILAAGQGTRMKSTMPKVLHTVGDRSMLEHSYDRAKALQADAIHIVYGHGGEQVKAALSHLEANWILQEQQNGTGHAVEVAMPSIDDDSMVLILYGDVPLVRVETLKSLVSSATKSGFGLLTAHLANPTGYGRIIRGANGAVERIVEQKDGSAEQLIVNEVNTGMLAVNSHKLRRWINTLDSDNAQGEFYLTDVIAMAAKEDVTINTVNPSSIDETLGANNRVQLAELERYLQQRKATQLMIDGVTLRDPARIDIRGELHTGQDVTIDINCLFEGINVLGSGVSVGANCIIRDSTIGDNVTIEPNTIIEKSSVGDHALVGPFARLRPDTVLHQNAKIGNFVEVKKSTIGAGSKVSHLSYIGDTTMGKNVNIGAGTITCNYDGINKHQTTIGDDVFVGSDSQLVAPVTIEEGATIGAGTTLSHTAPKDSLTLSRTRQKNIPGWCRPKKKQS